MSNADRMQDRRQHPRLTPLQGLDIHNHVLLDATSAVPHLSLRIGWGYELGRDAGQPPEILS